MLTLELKGYVSVQTIAEGKHCTNLGQTSPQSPFKYFRITYLHLHLPKISLEKILKVQSKAKKTTSIEPGCLLVSLKYDLSDPHQTLFNINVKRVSVQDEWRRATVIPLHKGGASIDLDNYRLISKISIICKAMQRII